jgi:restriction system protein
MILVAGLLAALHMLLRRQRRRAPTGLLGSLLHEFLLLVVRQRAPKARAAPKMTPASQSPVSTDRWSLELIKALEWKRFEELCQGYWQAKGWRCEGTGPGADGGIDFNLYRKEEPGTRFGVIQCKAKSKRQTGVEIARALYGVMHDAPDIKLGVLMSSGVISDDAKRFADGKPIQLIDGVKLLTLLRELPSAESTALLSHVVRDDFRTPSCVKCEIKMSLRSGHSGYRCGRCGNAFWHTG